MFASTLCTSAAKFLQIRASNSQTKPPISQNRESTVTHRGEACRDGDQVKTLITSTTNPFVKHCVKLRVNSSYRHSHGSALLLGSAPIREVYNIYDSKQELSTMINCLLVLDKAEIPHGLDELPIGIVRVSAAVMKKLSGLQSPDSLEAIAVMKIPSTFYNLNYSCREEDCRKWFQSPHRILVLDGIQDPGNLGTLLRSAVAFRWDGVFLLPGCCDPFNEKALRASRGASFRIRIVSGSWTCLQILREEYNLKVLAGHPESDRQSNPVYQLSQEYADSLAEMPLCLVLGSEGRGLSEKSRQVSELVSIPMAGEFESLNVSVAGRKTNDRS